MTTFSSLASFSGNAFFGSVFGAASGMMGLPNRSVCMALACAGAAPGVKAQPATNGLFEAIVQVENPTGKRTGKKGELGPAQISPIVLADVNRIYGTKFVTADCFSLETSRQIFWLYVNHYIHDYSNTNFNRAAIWNGGPRGPLKTRACDYAGRVCALLVP